MRRALQEIIAAVIDVAELVSAQMTDNTATRMQTTQEPGIYDFAWLSAIKTESVTGTRRS